MKSAHAKLFSIRALTIAVALARTSFCVAMIVTSLWVRAQSAQGHQRATRQASTRPKLVARSDLELGTRVDVIVGAALAQRNVPGAAVAILRNDVLVLAKGYGVAELE